MAVCVLISLSCVVAVVAVLVGGDDLVNGDCIDGCLCLHFDLFLFVVAASGGGMWLFGVSRWWYW